MRQPPKPGLLPGLAALLLAAGACAEPIVGDQDEDAPEDPIAAEVPDAARDALVAEVETLTSVLTATRDHLAQAANAEGLGVARDDADAAVELLIGEPTDEQPVLFPVETGERGAPGDRQDQLTSTLTAAREAGDAGRPVSGALREMLAGDLGAWQRDADGMVDLVESTAARGGPPEDAEQDVLELPGEGTRALAWALMARDAGSLEQAAGFAERGVAHLEVALSALGDLDLEDA